MKTYVWHPCCPAMSETLGYDKPRAIPEYDGKTPTGGRFTALLRFGEGLGEVLSLHFCPTCGRELRGKPEGWEEKEVKSSRDGGVPLTCERATVDYPGNGDVIAWLYGVPIAELVVWAHTESPSEFWRCVHILRNREDSP